MLTVILRSIASPSTFWHLKFSSLQWQSILKVRTGKFILTLSIASTTAWRTWTRSWRTPAIHIFETVRTRLIRRRSRFCILCRALEGLVGSGCRWVEQPWLAVKSFFDIYRYHNFPASSEKSPTSPFAWCISSKPLSSATASQSKLPQSWTVLLRSHALSKLGAWRDGDRNIWHGERSKHRQEGGQTVSVGRWRFLSINWFPTGNNLHNFFVDNFRMSFIKISLTRALYAPKLLFDH